jgi:hypothetical protein
MRIIWADGTVRSTNAMAQLRGLLHKGKRPVRIEVSEIEVAEHDPKIWQEHLYKYLHPVLAPDNTGVNVVSRYAEIPA